MGLEIQIGRRKLRKKPQRILTFKEKVKRRSELWNLEKMSRSIPLEEF